MEPTPSEPAMFEASTRISSIQALASYSIDNCGGQHALM
jgi:hypothetical protein